MNIKERKVHYKNRISEICSQELEKGQVVLLGDCVIENLKCDDYFPDSIIYNNGISGDTTSQLTETLYKRAIKFKPSKLFISHKKKCLN